jgi:hypothetical protein
MVSSESVDTKLDCGYWRKTESQYWQYQSKKTLVGGWICCRMGR